MKTLDCESIESTYKSLKTILGVEKSDLCQLFDSVDVYKEIRESFCGFLLSYIQKKTHCKTDFDKACFFHATRTWPDNTYEDGLLPTKQAEDKICNFLSKLVNRQATITPRGNAMIRQNKYNHGGPFGFLIRDFAFVRDQRYVNYFDCPEIVEDNSLKKEYKPKTVPCIVKFVDQWEPTTKAWIPTEALSVALLYAYHDHHDKKLGQEMELTYSFNGRNALVPKKNIFKVEFPRKTTII